MLRQRLISGLTLAGLITALLIIDGHLARGAAPTAASAIAHAGSTERLPRLLAGLTDTPVLPSLAGEVSGHVSTVWGTLVRSPGEGSDTPGSPGEPARP